MCGTIIFVNLPQNGCICNRYIHQESAALPTASPTGVRERNGEFNPSRLQIARYPLHRLFQSEVGVCVQAHSLRHHSENYHGHTRADALIILL
jgi:hypothetical protein